MSETKSTKKEVLEIDESIKSYYNLDEKKDFDMSAEQQGRLAAALQKKLEKVSKDYYRHLCGRIYDLIDPKDWDAFFFIYTPNQKPTMTLDYDKYRRDAVGYEKRYNTKVQGYTNVDVGFGMVDGDKAKLRDSYLQTIQTDKQNINKINDWAHKIGAKLQPVKL